MVLAASENVKVRESRKKCEWERFEGFGRITNGVAKEAGEGRSNGTTFIPQKFSSTVTHTQDRRKVFGGVRPS